MHEGYNLRYLGPIEIRLEVTSSSGLVRYSNGKPHSFAIVQIISFALRIICRKELFLVFCSLFHPHLLRSKRYKQGIEIVMNAITNKTLSIAMIPIEMVSGVTWRCHWSFLTRLFAVPTCRSCLSILAVEIFRYSQRLIKSLFETLKALSCDPRHDSEVAEAAKAEKLPTQAAMCVAPSSQVRRSLLTLD